EMERGAAHRGGADGTCPVCRRGGVGAVAIRRFEPQMHTDAHGWGLSRSAPQALLNGMPNFIVRHRTEHGFYMCASVVAFRACVICGANLGGMQGDERTIPL